MKPAKHYTVDKLIKFKGYDTDKEMSEWFPIPEDFITEERAVKWFNRLVERHPQESWKVTETTVTTGRVDGIYQYIYTHKTIKKNLANPNPNL